MPEPTLRPTAREAISNNNGFATAASTVPLSPRPGDRTVLSVDEIGWQAFISTTQPLLLLLLLLAEDHRHRSAPGRLRCRPLRRPYRPVIDAPEQKAIEPPSPVPPPSNEILAAPLFTIETTPLETATGQLRQLQSHPACPVHPLPPKC